VISAILSKFKFLRVLKRISKKRIQWTFR